MRVFEREPPFLIENGYLEKIEDFEYEGRNVLASRLGYRITARFVDRFLGRIFEVPGSVFPEEMLRPEKQSLADFVEGIDAIADAQRNVAHEYFEDGGIELACPPLRALLEAMVNKTFDESMRGMFTREYLLASGWYRERLYVQQRHDIALAIRLNAPSDRLSYLKSEAYRESLTGTIGADPCLSKTAPSTPA
jgi:hypothetical protein